MIKYTKLFILALFFSFPTKMNGQRNAEDAFTWAFKQIESYYGGVILDTTYLKYDTVKLAEKFPTWTEYERNFLRVYKARLTNIGFPKLPAEILDKVGTIKTLYSRNNEKNKWEFDDSLQLDKTDSLLYGRRAPKYGTDSATAILNVLDRSAFQQRIRNKLSEQKPKLLTVLSIFEGEQFYLIICQFTQLFGYPHYSIVSELVLK